MAKLRLSNVFKIGEIYPLITRYLEVPVRTKMKLKWVDNEGRLLGFEWGRGGLRSAFSTEPVYVFCDGEYAKTSVFSSSGKELVLMLENFGPPPDYMRRRSVRVVPDDKKPVSVTLKHEGAQIRAKVIDISESGVGVELEKGQIDPEEVEEITVEVELPSNPPVIASGKGKIKRVENTGTAFRLGIEVSFDKDSQSYVRKFVIQRQREIIISLRMVE